MEPGIGNRESGIVQAGAVRAAVDFCFSIAVEGLPANALLFRFPIPQSRFPASNA